MAKIFCLLALCCLAGACGSGNEKKQTTASKNFQMIEVPSILDNPDDRAAYIGKNYWRNFDFTDTSLIGKPETTEQAFADYVHIIEHMNAETAAASFMTPFCRQDNRYISRNIESALLLAAPSVPRQTFIPFCSME